MKSEKTGQNEKLDSCLLDKKKLDHVFFKTSFPAIDGGFSTNLRELGSFIFPVFPLMPSDPKRPKNDQKTI